LSAFALLASAAFAAEPAPIVRTRAEPLLIESVAFDSRGGMLVSSVHAGGVFRVARDGRLVRWSKGDARNGAQPGVFGIVSDPARHALWAATAGGPHSATPARAPAIVRYDLRTGRARQIVNGSATAKSFGDVALGPDGSVFVSDSGAGDVLRLRPGASSFEVLARLGDRGSPQGLAVSPDGKALIFAGYGSGLHRVDLASGAYARIETPAGMELRGIDGVARDGASLVAVQNGIAPPRVLRIRLNADWSAIEGLDVLVRDGGMQEPTGGVVRNGQFVFVSRSQWTDFDAQGRPTSAAPAPAVVSRLPLGTDAAP
jgi:sugar lactone lactonase YvrE